MNIPSKVRLIDVGPRDGLQNEKQPVPAAVKIELVHRLQAAGCREIEVTSFVSPKWVPQLADAAEVFAGIRRAPGVAYPVLVPNLQGYERAIAVGAREVAVFTAASEASAANGSNCRVISTRVPCPGSLSRRSVAPIISQRLRLITRPRPAPLLAC